MLWPPLPCHNLDRAELETLVGELARAPEQWSGEVAFGDERRHFISLYRDDYVDVWLICWRDVDDTGWHDHDVSSGAVRVVRGAIRESMPRIGGDPVERVVPAGACFSFGPDHIHRLSGGEYESVSIHAYSPPLWRLGQYSIAGDGVMRRQSISYADELRPIQDELAA
ncbi:MAG TPA: cysteine dioxygenase family protein [Solirubrobacteraceae bacterium]